jgi:hypothetical protein
VNHIKYRYPSEYFVPAWLNENGCTYLGTVMIKLDKENNVFINNEQIGHVDEFLKCAA